MQINHILSTFFLTIFLELIRENKVQLIHELKVYCNYGPYKSKVIINDKLVTIDPDKEKFIAQEGDCSKILALLEKKDYSETKAILSRLIYNKPTFSEFHRVFGQMLSDGGIQKKVKVCVHHRFILNPVYFTTNHF